MNIEEIRGAVARGWEYPKNTHKTMDVDLADAIANEIHKLDTLFLAFKEPQLGYATTGELLDEIKARIGVDGKLGYRTIDPT